MGMLFFLLFVIVIAAIVGCVVVYVKSYNDLVTKKNKVKNSWGHIEAQLQRRFDLVPTLVETVKGYAIHERQIIDNVVAARTGYMSAMSSKEKLMMDATLNSQLSSLYTIVEGYPQLKADAQFLKMQEALTEIEEDISFARQFYNDAVTIYNNQLMSFPSNIIANKHGFKEEAMFDAVQAADIAPKIDMRYTTKSKCPVCGAAVNGNTTCKYCGSSLV